MKSSIIWNLNCTFKRQLSAFSSRFQCHYATVCETSSALINSMHRPNTPIKMFRVLPMYVISCRQWRHMQQKDDETLKWKRGDLIWSENGVKISGPRFCSYHKYNKQNWQNYKHKLRHVNFFFIIIIFNMQHDSIFCNVSPLTPPNTYLIFFFFFCRDLWIAAVGSEPKTSFECQDYTMEIWK